MGTSAYFTEKHYEVYFEKPVTYHQNSSYVPLVVCVPQVENPCFRGRG